MGRGRKRGMLTSVPGAGLQVPEELALLVQWEMMTTR
jgi:hypothetical protein